MKKKYNQISLLFGMDDHWGPLSHFEEVKHSMFPDYTDVTCIADDSRFFQLLLTKKKNNSRLEIPIRLNQKRTFYRCIHSLT